jgi:hypothetical protein
MRRKTPIALAALLFLAACERHAEPAHPSAAAPTAAAQPAPRLPDDDAGRVIARAIDAAGGWDAWQRHRDAAFVSTLTIFDGRGNATSETIFLHKLPLHHGLKTRLESIGLRDEVTFGFDGRETWMLHDGQMVTEPAQTAFTRFHAISSLYWFSLPFVLAEVPGTLSYLGHETDGAARWEKVRVAYSDPAAVPADWLVLYIDAASGLIDHLHCHVTAEFLRHTLWVGTWHEYRDANGIKKERRRSFFPADPGGAIIGPLAAEQLVEHVRFDNGFAPDLFTRPLAAGGGNPAR